MHWASSPELEQYFTTEERDRRWARIREAMDARGIDLLVALPQWMVEDSLYLANETGAVLFPLVGDPAIIIGGEGSDRAVKQKGWIGDRASATAGGSTRVPYGAAVAERMGAMGLTGKRVAIAGLRGSDLVLVRQPEGYANYTTVNTIAAAIPGAEIVDGTPVMAAARHQKSEAELQVMRAAIRIAEAGSTAMHEHTRPGVEQAEVFAQMLIAMMRAGATVSETSWCGGPWGEHKWRYVTPPPGVIGERWHVGAEIMPQLRGYNCQIQQAVWVGPMEPQAEEIFALNAAAFERSCQLMRTGALWDEVEAEVMRVADGTDYEICFLLHGRGLGNEGPILIPVDSHESVRGVALAEGSTFVVKPYAFPKGVGYVHVTRQTDVTWGDTVVVRKDGAERLGSRPIELLRVP